MAWPIVTIDLDGTLVRTTVFDAIAEHLGGAAREGVDRFDELFFAGAMSLEACFMAEYDLFFDVPLDEVRAALDAAEWVDGIEATVAALKEAGSAVLVLTDQPNWAVDHVADRFGFDGASCTHAHIHEDRVGAVRRYNFEKLAGLDALLDAHRFRRADVAHVGNGSNDVPVFEAVELAIAFNPSGPDVEEAADAVVQGNDLRDVLKHLLD